LRLPGFSYSDHILDEGNLRTPEMMREVFTLLQQLFQLYPQYASLPFWVFGESYGGHYVPSLTALILSENNAVRNGSAPSSQVRASDSCS
jgi:carboxypeptidase C (cathepsin A)